MDFEKWIDTLGGRSDLARLLNVTRQNVDAWLLGKCYPRVGVVLKIIALSENKITFSDITKACAPKTKRVKRNAKNV